MFATRLIAVFALAICLPAGAGAQERAVPQSREAVEYSYAPLVKQAAPAVVNVYASRRVEARPTSPMFNDPFFRRFFDMPDFAPRQRESQSLGSGVIVSGDGFIVTNYHVIKDADEIRVALADGREYPAEAALKDERSDLAVLKIEAANLPSVVLGNSDDLEVGDIVLAIGNPFGVGQTVTSGIISALARTKVGITDYGFFIQTDAAINPGNSGGALINMRGELIGINTAIFSRSGGSNGIGFAIPANMVRIVVQSAQGGLETVARPWFGADLQAVTSDIAASLGLERPSGALVTHVEPDSPAEAAGLKRGDLITAIDEAAVNDPESFNYFFGTKGVEGQTVLHLLRGNREVEAVIVLAPAPAPEPGENLLIAAGPLAGALIEPVTPATVEEFRLAARQGMVVRKVEPLSAAASIGLRPGDVIIAINGVELTDVEAARRATEAQNRSWQLVIQRGNSIMRQFYRR